LLYSTPPVTFSSVIKKVKKSNPKVKTYLLLKDIFPQNAVDINLFSKSSLIYKYFRKKEISLYKLSDYIGCMSQANVNYILNNNKFLDHNRVEVCPNSIEIGKSPRFQIDKVVLQKKYNIPENRTIFLYGGNLGKPQGVNFIESAIEAFEKIEDVFLFIVGSGTEFSRLKKFIQIKKLKKTLIHAGLDKEQYDSILSISDVGLIFLDYRFTIPNFPSRLLSYMENCLPVISVTDESTDIGAICESAKFGIECRSNNINYFTEKVIFMRDKVEERLIMGNNGYTYLIDNYTVENSYGIIMKHF
jgi:glycosyltransferase involved in cell wall biosynthesis